MIFVERSNNGMTVVYNTRFLDQNNIFIYSHQIFAHSNHDF